MSKSAKGPAFERWFCEQLSLWFSGGSASDWFWRTAGSGARATTRSKKGKSTRGHYGDITSTCPEADAFSRQVLLELKRGYNKVSLQDLLDTRKKAKTPVLDEWISKAMLSAGLAGIPNWMIVFRRDRKEPIVILPSTLSQMFPLSAECLSGSIVQMGCFLRGAKKWQVVIAMPLERFFKVAPPEVFKGQSDRKLG